MKNGDFTIIAARLRPAARVAKAARLGACAAALGSAAAGCLRYPTTVVNEPRRVAPKDDDAPITESDRPGAQFMLDGQPLCFLGTNNYYLTFKPKKMVDDVLETSKAMNLKVVRVWGYIDKGSLDKSVPSLDGPGDKEGIYFQYWDPATGRTAYNDGATGLEHLDYVLDKAEKLDLKVLVVLTNNWHDFGGMDQYLTWYGLKEHHQFYTDPKVAGAFKDWISHLVFRKNAVNGRVYRDDPTIFAWELANEPRTINYTSFDKAAGWTLDTIPRWADDVSAYIKSIDPNHLVAVGDEGFLAGGDEWGYDGESGGNHKALLALKGIDFGTYHLYPDSWGRSLRWASKWIQDHIEIAQSAGKPSMLEEYGVIAHRTPSQSGPYSDTERRDEAYPRWHEILLKRGGNAALFWMLAGVDEHHGLYPDYDGFEIHGNEPVAALMKSLATKLPTEGQSCRLYRKLSPEGEPAKGHFVTVSRTPLVKQAQGDRAPADLRATSDRRSPSPI